jgi:hypothetical protein
MTEREVEILLRVFDRFGKAHAGEVFIGRGGSDAPYSCGTVDVGWRCAILASGGSECLPLLSMPCYRWVSAAVHLLRGGPRIGRRIPDVKYVMEARKLTESPDSSCLIRSAIFAVDSSAINVSVALGIPVGIVEAFDGLFFNVLDRKGDRGYRLQIAGSEHSGSLGLAKRLGGVDCSEPLLETALHGSLEDVLIIAKVKPDKSLPSQLAEEVQRKALAAAVEWSKRSDVPPSQLVSLGLDIARKTGADNSTESHDSFSTGRLIRDQLRIDAEQIRHSFDLERESELT